MTTLMDTVRIEAPKRSPVRPVSPLDPSWDDGSEIPSAERSFQDAIPQHPVGPIWRWAVGSPSGAKQHDQRGYGSHRSRVHDPSSARSRSSRPVDTLGPSWASSPTSTTRRRRTWCSRVTGCSSGSRCVTSRAHTAFRGVVRSLPTPSRRCRGFGARQPFRPRRERWRSSSPDEGQEAPRRCLRACRQAKIGTNSRTFAPLYLSSECLAAWSIKSSRCPSNSSISCSLSLGNGSLIHSSSGLIRSWATPGRLFR